MDMNYGRGDAEGLGGAGWRGDKSRKIGKTSIINKIYLKNKLITIFTLPLHIYVSVFLFLLCVCVPVFTAGITHDHSKFDF